MTVPTNVAAVITTLLSALQAPREDDAVVEQKKGKLAHVSRVAILQILGVFDSSSTVLEAFAPPTAQALLPALQRAAADALICGREDVQSSAHSLESLFVQISTTIHSYTTITGLNGNPLPPNVAGAAMAVAESIFSIQWAVDLKQQPLSEHVSLRQKLLVELEKLWLHFIFIFLQQLSSRGGDFSGWTGFFQDCRSSWEAHQRKTTMVLSDDEAAEEASPPTVSTAALLLACADETNKDERLEHLYPRVGISIHALAQAAWALVSPTFMTDVLGKTRFHRATLLFKSNVPHMLTQAPGSAFQVYYLLHHFSSEWLRVMESVPLGTLTKSAFGWLMRQELEDESVAKLMQDAQSSDDETERKLFGLVEKAAQELSTLLGQSGIHGYLLASILGAELCSRFVIPKQKAAMKIRPPVRSSTSTSAATSDSLLEESAWLPSRPIESCGEDEWILRNFPPLGLLLQHLQIDRYLIPHLFMFSAQLRIGLSPTHHADARQAFAMVAWLSRVCPTHTSLCIYHYAAHPPTPQDPQGSADAAYPLPTAVLADYTAAVRRHVELAESELILDTANMDMGRVAKPRQANRATPVVVSGPAFRNGEIKGNRFCEMRYPEPYPLWSKFVPALMAAKQPLVLSGGAAPSPAPLDHEAATSPCRIILELLAAHYYGLADFLIAAFLREGVDVFLPPRTALTSSVSIQSYVVDASVKWLSTWKAERVRGAADDDGRSRVGSHIRVLEELAPLWKSAQTYLATQTLLLPLLEELTWICSASCEALPKASEALISDDDALPIRCIFSMAESIVVEVVMPCLRVLPPSPLLYDSLQGLFVVLQANAPLLQYGTNDAEFLHTSMWTQSLVDPQSVQPRCHPHDQLRSKEHMALFQRAMNRLNKETVDEYRILLRPVLYAQPMFVGVKLLTQAIGYENSALSQHLSLLRGMPSAFLTLLAHQSISMMRGYAKKERIGGSEVTSLSRIATFVASLWRDNCKVLDGAILLRTVEMELRSDWREGFVMGTELLKSILFQALHRKLESEEKFSDAQMLALSSPATTRSFGKGEMESFRLTRWDEDLSPLDLVQARQALRTVLHEPWSVPVEVEEESGQDEEGPVWPAPKEGATRTLTLGQHILLHLCRVHSRIHELQMDLDGPQGLALMTTAQDYNTLNDLIFAVEELIDDAPPESMLVQVSLPALALRISARSRMKQFSEASSSSTSLDIDVLSSALGEARFATLPPSMDAFRNLDAVEGGVWSWWAAASGAVPYELTRMLSYLSSSTFSFVEATYTAATAEAQLCHRKVEAMSAKIGSKSAPSPTHAAILRWLKLQEQRIKGERDLHENIYAQSGPARAALLEYFKAHVLREHADGVDGQMVALASSYLLPRALLTHEDTLTVEELLVWLLSTTRSEEKKNECYSPDGNYAKVLQLVLTLISSAVAYFLGFTDSEAKRVGHLINRLLCAMQADRLPSLSDLVRRIKAVHATHVEAAASDNPAGPRHAAETPNARLHLLLAPTPRGLWEVAKAVLSPLEEKTEEPVEQQPAAEESKLAATISVVPMQLEAYLIRFVLQFLDDERDVPSHIHRNVLLMLERLDKRDTFPSSLSACEVLMRSVHRHAQEKMPNFAIAMATLRALRQRLLGLRGAMEHIQNYLDAGSSASTTPGGDEGCFADVKDCFRCWRMQEEYMRELLVSGKVVAVEDLLVDDEPLEEANSPEAANDENTSDDGESVDDLEGESVDGIDGEDDVEGSGDDESEASSSSSAAHSAVGAEDEDVENDENVPGKKAQRRGVDDDLLQWKKARSEHDHN